MATGLVATAVVTGAVGTLNAITQNITTPPAATALGTFYVLEKVTICATCNPTTAASNSNWHFLVLLDPSSDPTHALPAAPTTAAVTEWVGVAPRQAVPDPGGARGKHWIVVANEAGSAYGLSRGESFIREYDLTKLPQTAGVNRRLQESAVNGVVTAGSAELKVWWYNATTGTVTSEFAVISQFSVAP